MKTQAFAFMWCQIRPGNASRGYMRRRGGHPARQRMKEWACGAGAGFDLVRMSGHPAASASSGPRKTGGGKRSSWQERKIHRSPASELVQGKCVLAGEPFFVGHGLWRPKKNLLCRTPLIFAMTPVQPWRTARPVIEARLAEQGVDG